MICISSAVGTLLVFLCECVRDCAPARARACACACARDECARAIVYRDGSSSDRIAVTENEPAITATAGPLRVCARVVAHTSVVPLV